MTAPPVPRPRFHRLAALLAALVVPTAVFGGCDADGALVAPPTGPVDLVVHLDDYERWEASGPAVDEELLCPSGRRHRVGLLDPAGRAELGWWAWSRMLADLDGPTDRPDALLIVEHACDDGSGSFTALENQQRGDWEVQGGTGAYADLTATGTVSFVADDRAEPWQLHIVADLG